MDNGENLLFVSGNVIKTCIQLIILLVTRMRYFHLIFLWFIFIYQNVSKIIYKLKIKVMRTVLFVNEFT
jgi:hypothetical protein